MIQPCPCPYTKPFHFCCCCCSCANTSTYLERMFFLLPAAPPAAGRLGGGSSPALDETVDGADAGTRGGGGVAPPAAGGIGVAAPEWGAGGACARRGGEAVEARSVDGAGGVAEPGVEAKPKLPREAVVGDAVCARGGGTTAAGGGVSEPACDRPRDQLVIQHYQQTQKANLLIDPSLLNGIVHEGRLLAQLGFDRTSRLRRAAVPLEDAPKP